MLRFEMLTHRTPHWFADEFRAMGSDAQIVFPGSNIGLLTWAREEIERLESLWSRFRPGSDVCRANASEPERPVGVALETVDLIDRAMRLWSATDGWFDPTILPALERVGYRSPFADLDAPPVVASSLAPSAAPGCASIALDRHAATVTLPAGVRLDLGGIGKGMAADLIATGLVERGAEGACVSLGGDIRCCGAGPDAGGWDIEIEHPSGATLLVQRLIDDAVVMSTPMYRRWTDHVGREWHHLIDPRTGLPSRTDLAAVAAAAPEAWWAEGVAKAALLAGPGVGLELARRLGVDCWFADSSGSIIATTDIHDGVLC